MDGLREQIVLYMVKSINLCILFIALISCKSESSRDNYSNQELGETIETSIKKDFNCTFINGVWFYEGNNDNQDFELQFDIINDTIYGKHCLIYGLQGDLIDCDAEDRGSIFECLKNGTYKGELNSYYFPDTKSEIILTVRSIDTIIFNVIPETKSFSYFRSGMVFTKNKN